MNHQLFVKAIISLFLCGISFNATSDNDKFSTPSTISTEAKDFIGNFKKTWRDKAWPAPDDIEGWQDVKNKYEVATLENNKKLIEKLGATIEESTINNDKLLYITPRRWDKSNKLIIYIHGGAYTLFSAETSLTNILPLADNSNIKVVSIDYKTAPQAKWKETVNNVANSIKYIYQQNSKPSSVVVLGDSAGGGLATAALLKLQNENHTMPAALILWSPWVDLSGSGDSYQTLKDAELHFKYDSLLKHSADAYASPNEQKNQYVSPIYGTFKSTFPPTLIQGGTKELLLSDFVRLYQKINQANGKAKLDLYEGMWHVFQGIPDIPESKTAIKNTTSFINSNLN